MKTINADIQRYIQTMPDYRESLDFLQNILSFQAGLADKIEVNFQIEPSAAREKWQAGQPLFAGESLSISSPLFQEALAELRPLLPLDKKLQITLDRLLDLPLNIEPMLDALLTDSKTCIQQVADATSADPDTIAFLLRLVISPFLEKQSLPYQDLVEAAGWRHGFCPICGSEPWMARLSQDEGRRILACSLCHTEWVFARLRCPFCASDGQPKLNHFTVDGDEARRVDCCDQCHRYIKTVDERMLAFPVNLSAEDVITTHLDTLAQEQGYW